ncbi:hypothetical protein FLL45_06345 [Aliikangiella marina]|uniref:TIGR03016 family PEP-CTERM system-associated outer membrane protein n=1 Tax=Aliikangiella marina TaxID=1712262 RepID=A0A545TBJ5_9GAMM|nr:hypothetical protein [Aliikangiella marina]TQV74579.1 hypothetical protein FLL45_06345 [Aliikangiella marina]
MVSTSLRAAQYNYSIITQVEDSNNISGQLDGEEGEAYSLGLNFGLDSFQLREWDIDLAGQVSSVEYSDDTLQNEELYDFQSSVLYKPLQSKFTLLTLLNYGQVPINRFSTQEVNNVRDERVAVMRPRYYFSLSPTDRINLEYTYFDYYLEETEQVIFGQNSSNATQSFLVNYEKQVNPTSALSLNLRTAITEYEESEQSAIDYDRDDIFLRWVMRDATNQIQLDLGQSEIVDDNNQELNQDLQVLTLTRQINVKNNIELAYSNSFNNQLDTNQNANTVNVNQQNAFARVQIVEEYSIGFTHDDALFDFTLSFSDAEIEQFQSDDVERRKLGSIGIDYSLNRLFNNGSRSSIRLNYIKSESEFDTNFTSIAANEIENYSVTFNYAFSSNFQISLQHATRNSIQLNVDSTTSEIDTESIFLNFIYSDRGRL